MSPHAGDVPGGADLGCPGAAYGLPVTIAFTEFLPLRPDGGTGYVLPVSLGLCSALQTLWGGCGLAAAVEAMEQASQRPCSWAAVQYVRPIHPGRLLALEVELAGAGRRITQAQVSGRVDGELVLVGHGSLGGGGETDVQFVSPPPEVPDPEQCPERTMPLVLDASGTFLERFEQRWAQPPPPSRSGLSGTGRTLVWIRLREPVETTRGALAVLADLAPSAISEALGVMAGGVSLDNTIRYARAGSVPPGGWLLLDVVVEAVVADIAQLSVRVFDREGRLLAVGGQSAVVRRVAEPRTRPPGR